MLAQDRSRWCQGVGPSERNPIRTKAIFDLTGRMFSFWRAFVLLVFRFEGLAFTKTFFKDILFQISRSVLLATCHQCAMILLETSALYKLFTYLLTYLHTYNMFNTFWRVMFVVHGQIKQKHTTQNTVLYHHYKHIITFTIAQTKCSAIPVPCLVILVWVVLVNGFIVHT